GSLHPGVEPVAHLGKRLRVHGIGCQVTGLVRIKEDVEELLARDELVFPATLNPQLLARAVIAVRQNRMLALAETPNVIPPPRTSCALRLISSMIIHFREELFMQFLNTTSDE